MSLPGVKTVIKDRFYVLSRGNVPVGARVLIIGRRTTADGTGDGTTDRNGNASSVADLDVYVARKENEVIAAFGDGSDLHRGYLEASAGGASRILMVPLPSDTVFDHNTPDVTSADYGGSVFEAAFSAAESARPDIIVPWGRGAGPLEFQNPATPGDDPEIGFYADNTSTVANSWVKKVADRVSQITANSHPCMAVLGVAPYQGAATSDGGMTPGNVSTHLGLSNLVDFDSIGTEIADTDPVEYTGLGVNGPYVSVVATEIEPLGYNNNTNFGFANGAATYAGAITQLDSWSATTGKTIFNVESIRYNPTRTQQQNLIDAGVVPVALNFNRVPVWVDGQTFGATGSDYKRLTTLRIVFDAVQMVRQVSQSFIGEAASIEQRNALETAITSGLRGMQQAQALLASDFTVQYVAVENKAIIDLVLTPAFELRNIEVSVSVQLG